MFRLFATFGSVCVFLLLSATALSASEKEPSTETFCHELFGRETHAARLALADTNVVVNAVTQNGHTCGWIFWTDQVPPACKGKRGQIAVLVALGTDARIKGITVFDHKEDAPYFKRLKDPFFRQFHDQRAGDPNVKLDAVTHATLSSRAIIRDVMEGAKNVLSQPEVAAQVGSFVQLSQ